MATLEPPTHPDGTKVVRASPVVTAPQRAASSDTLPEGKRGQPPVSWDRFCSGPIGAKSRDGQTGGGFFGAFGDWNCFGPR